MSKKMVPGTCHICGKYGNLSYEHVPPEAAFNNRRVLLASADEYWNRGVSQGQKVQGNVLKRGFGAHTLCERCNSITGSWYGAHFVEWCRQGMEFWDKTKGKSSVIVLHTIYPLPIIKQVVT